VRQPGAPPVAVLDTSVLVPAWSRVTLQILASGAPPRYQPVWSEWIIAETWRVLTERLVRAGAARGDIADRANAMLRHLLPVMRLVSVATVPPAARQPPISDPNDALVWATAVIADAGYIVSHNTAHFPPLVPEQAVINSQHYQLLLHRHQGIEFLTAIEFIEGVLGEDAATIYERALPPGGIVRSRRSVTPV
jgi:predicted nucleic acid-binding protein